MKAKDERKVNPIQEMLRIVTNFSNLSERGFKESYRSIKEPQLIYDSEWCRIAFIWGGWDYSDGNSISINYGRLHAPNDNETMIWNGEECYAWHKLKPTLHLLDDYTPSEAVYLSDASNVTSKFYRDDYLEKFYRRQPEWLMTMHMEVWQHYGKQFFELFDLRQPDLWERYRQFLKEYYDIEGRLSFITPSLDKVC